MRIVHVTSYFQPGMGYQENRLAPAQARLGHRVTMIASDRYPPYAGMYNTMMQATSGDRFARTGREVFEGVELFRLPARWEWPAHHWICLKGLWRQIAALRPDIIHAHNVITVPTLQILAGNLWRRYPLVIDDHNNFFNCEPLTRTKKLLYRGFKYGCRPLTCGTVGRFLPMSHEVRRYLHRELGIAPERTTLNFLGTDPDRFRPDDGARAQIRERLGLPSDAVVIVNAGKISESKDNDVLLRAMGKIARETDNAYLIMIGNAEPDLAARLKRIAEDERLGARLRWLDFLPNRELPAYYAAADIGVWPGDWSVTVLEGAGCGLALVLPDREYAQYSVMNDNGIVFERGRVDALARALERLIADPALRESMRKRSRELIETRLNWDQIAREAVAVYEEVINHA